MPYFKTKDNCRIHYEITEGRPLATALVFINGTGQTIANQRSNALVFKKKFKVITYDPRAHGMSDKGSVKLDINMHVEDLLTLFDYLRIEKAILVGTSHGARIAISFALKNPERVLCVAASSIGLKMSWRTKTLVKSWYEILDKSSVEAMAWAFVPWIFGNCFLMENQSLLPKIVKAISSRNKKESLMAHLKAMMGYPSFSQTLSPLLCPGIFLYGSDDIMVEEKDAIDLSALCEGKFVKIEGSGHMIHVEAPHEFQKILFDFFDKVLK